MDLHEFQTKSILRKYGIPIPDFSVFSTLEELQSILSKTSLDQAVLKIQVHAGGRGKGGGVKLAKNRQEIFTHAQPLLGMKLTNSQTGPDGVIARQVLITPLINYKKEFYVAAVIDRQKAEAVLIVSPEGGTEIEEIAKTHPDKIMRMPIGPCGKMRAFQLFELSKFMGWHGATAEQGKTILSALAKAFIECDASLLEINPLVETAEGNLLALDAKLSVDDNALFRQKEIAKYYDLTQLSPSEAQAKQYDLAYVALDGEIGCMVNGAGLAMATMDIIKLYGGTPANFLDVGGGASQDKVAEGFKIILSDPKVKAILVNIFGGIMNCATLAAGIIAAANELQVNVPLIIRMEGTNVEEGKKMLRDSGINAILANDLAEAANQVVAAAKRS
jgi:succinyl-CoA synthetase beta subunit